MKLLGCVALIFCLSDCMENNRQLRVLGQEISEVDKETMKKIEDPADIKLDDTVAVSHNGCWIYARVQYLPHVPLWMGLVNWCRKDPNENYGGRAINYKRHVRKLPIQMDQ